MVRVCEVLNYKTTEGQGVRVHTFPKHNLEQQNAWVNWIALKRPGWNLKSNSRIVRYFIGIYKISLKHSPRVNVYHVLLISR